jgi:hypothetical protein
LHPVDYHPLVAFDDLALGPDHLAFDVCLYQKAPALLCSSAARLLYYSQPSGSQVHTSDPALHTVYQLHIQHLVVVDFVGPRVSKLGMAEKRNLDSMRASLVTVELVVEERSHFAKAFQMVIVGSLATHFGRARRSQASVDLVA